MKTILLICAVALSVFAQTQAQIIVQEGETRVLRGQRFENFTGDFVIKNFGFLIIENCTIQNNFLGGANVEAKFVEEKRVVAPIINFGTLQIGNSIFVDNFARNASLSFDYSAQIAAGAIANFGNLVLADDNVFERNIHQRGRFAIIRNYGIQRIAYIGDDKVFNAGNVEILHTERSGELAQNNNIIGLEIEAAIVQNPVPANENARVFVRVNRPTNVRITVLNMVGSVVHSAQEQVVDTHTFVWNLRAGQSRESSYTVRVEAENFSENLQLGVRR